VVRAELAAGALLRPTENGVAVSSDPRRARERLHDPENFVGRNVRSCWMKRGAKSSTLNAPSGESNRRLEHVGVLEVALNSLGLVRGTEEEAPPAPRRGGPKDGRRVEAGHAQTRRSHRRVGPWPRAGSSRSDRGRASVIRSTSTNDWISKYSRYVLPMPRPSASSVLLTGLGLLSLAIGYFVLARTTQRWFERDLLLRTQLAVSSASESLGRLAWRRRRGAAHERVARRHHPGRAHHGAAAVASMGEPSRPPRPTQKSSPAKP
jgi:hypothetical protein